MTLHSSVQCAYQIGRTYQEDDGLMDKTIRDHEQSQNNFLSIWRTFFLPHRINQINHIQTLLLISLVEITMILSWDFGVCSHHLYERSILVYGYDSDILVNLRMQRLFVSTSLKDQNDDYKKRRYWKRSHKSTNLGNRTLYSERSMVRSISCMIFFIHRLPTFVRTNTY